MSVRQRPQDGLDDRGTYGDVSIDTGHVRGASLRLCLLKSAWKHVYSGLNIDRIASAEDKSVGV
ncbi:hypothetical protein XH96_33900 [Bradyrhizobium sp. CCBAU 51765]|nr:hypothetical protein XH96_33900 [Bradyrhizobium sp. CCBAU 51765]